jgi:excinuclease UvrABC nuclease subunit
MLHSNPLAQQELKRVMADVDAATVDMGKVLHLLSVRAVAKLEETMESASNETLRFKAAQDLADRGPQTSKVQRHQVETWSMSSDDAKAIADAMVESAQIRQQHAKFAEGSHDMTGVSSVPLLTDGSGSK